MRRPHVLRPAALAVLLMWAGAAPAVQPPASYPNTDGFGIDFEKSEDWYRHCMRVERLVPPRLPSPPAPRLKSGRCDATGLYYLKRDQEGTSDAEWRDVRECAEASGDDAVLMMLYANGYGVARDADRALSYACRLDSAKAEMEGRVAYLTGGAPVSVGQPFDLCDHATSGRLSAVCADLRETRKARVRTARLERFAAALPAQALRPFAQLRKAAEAFAVQTQAEVDMSGTGAPGFALHHAARRRDEFVRAVLDAANGKLARATRGELVRLDAELNAAYRQLQGRPLRPSTRPSTVTRADLRKTERAWLAYRDAWGPFLAAARLPADLVSVKALLTRQRIAQLARI